MLQEYYSAVTHFPSEPYGPYISYAGMSIHNTGFLLRALNYQLNYLFVLKFAAPQIIGDDIKLIKESRLGLIIIIHLGTKHGCLNTREKPEDARTLPQEVTHVGDLLTREED